MVTQKSFFSGLFSDELGFRLSIGSSSPIWTLNVTVISLCVFRFLGFKMAF